MSSYFVKGKDLEPGDVVDTGNDWYRYLVVEMEWANCLWLVTLPGYSLVDSDSGGEVESEKEFTKLNVGETKEWQKKSATHKWKTEREAATGISKDD